MSSLLKRSIDADTAMRAITAVVEKAKSMNLKVAVVVADESGHVKASLCMDGSQLLALQVATDKAFTAVCMRAPTDALFEVFKADPPLLLGIPHIPRVRLFGGGFPIQEGGYVIGGLGVSGGHYTEDMLCASSGLEAIGATYRAED